LVHVVAMFLFVLAISAGPPRAIVMSRLGITERGCANSIFLVTARRTNHIIRVTSYGFILVKHSLAHSDILQGLGLGLDISSIESVHALCCVVE
jgi:hypothetical protein